MFDPSFIADFSNSGLVPSVHGGGDAAGGGVVGLLDSLLQKLTPTPETGGAGFEFLPGLQTLGSNIHPTLVHFPIAFLSVFFLLDLLGSLPRWEKLRQTASAMLYCGSIGAVLTAAAGLYAASFVPHSEAVHEIMEWHEHLGITVASLASALSVWRLIAKGRIVGMARALHLLLAAIMTLCMLFGADLGGLMVYEHGVAVHQLQAAPDAQHHLHDNAHPAD